MGSLKLPPPRSTPRLTLLLIPHATSHHIHRRRHTLVDPQGLRELAGQRHKDGLPEEAIEGQKKRKCQKEYTVAINFHPRTD